LALVHVRLCPSNFRRLNSRTSKLFNGILVLPSGTCAPRQPSPHETILRYRRKRPETKASLCCQESISGVRPCCSSSTQFTGNSLRPRFQVWQVRTHRDDRDSCSTIRLSERQRFPSSRLRRISHALKTRFHLQRSQPWSQSAFPLRPWLASIPNPNCWTICAATRAALTLGCPRA
jgi:hypothetical protein